MPITSYTELKTAIVDWSHRGDVATITDDFIDMAESEIWKTLRIRDMEVRSTASLSTRFIELPTGFVEMRRIRISGSNSYDLEYRTPEAMNIDDDTGRPRFYTVTSELEFDRTPDSTYTLEMQYIRSLTALSSSNTSNAVLSRFPMIYLFGSLWALYTWSLQEDKADFYQNKFLMAIRDANAQDKRGRYGAAPAMRVEGPTP